MPILYIVIAVVVAFVLYLVVKYNGFVTLKTRAQEAWADIDVQLKRRYDLIPNLVNTVKGYATHESSAFENVEALNKFPLLLASIIHSFRIVIDERLSPS